MKGKRGHELSHLWVSQTPEPTVSFRVSIWHGLYAPKGTPKPVLDMMNAALRNALKDPEFMKRQEALGAVIITDNRVNPADHKKFVEAEINKWGPAIKAAGQYAD